MFAENETLIVKMRYFLGCGLAWIGRRERLSVYGNVAANVMF